MRRMRRRASASASMSCGRDLTIRSRRHGGRWWACFRCCHSSFRRCLPIPDRRPLIGCYDDPAGKAATDAAADLAAQVTELAKKQRYPSPCS